MVGERNWFVFFTVTNFLMSFGAFFVWYYGGQQILRGEMTLVGPRPRVRGVADLVSRTSLELPGGRVKTESGEVLLRLLRPGALHQNFVAFGLYLASLHELLASLDCTLDVRSAFMRSYRRN